MSVSLFSFRTFRLLDPEHVAKELAISLKEYEDLEAGLEPVDAETALRLSEIYRVPPQLFLTNNTSKLSIIYSHCHFENSNGYVNHLYQHYGEVKAKDETIQLLKEEIKRLHDRNSELMDLLFKIT